MCRSCAVGLERSLANAELNLAIQEANLQRPADSDHFQPLKCTCPHSVMVTAEVVARGQVVIASAAKSQAPNASSPQLLVLNAFLLLGNDVAAANRGADDDAGADDDQVLDDVLAF